jgi:peptide/nickel transport system substrate-binding protein
LRAAVVGVLSLALAACGGDARPAGGGELTWAIEQPWGATYNTYRPEGGSYYLRQILAGTTPRTGDFSPDGQWTWSTDLFAQQPSMVATSPQTMKFPISPEAVWSDGEPIDVDDFRFAWFHNSGRGDQCTGCDPASTAGWELVDKIDAADDGRTVTITLRQGVADAEWFAHFEPSRYPAHVAEAEGFDWRTPAGMGRASDHFAKTVPSWSGGPYRLDSAVPDERAILVPNPKWYGKVRPKLDRIVLEVLPNAGDWPVAVQNDELDGGSPLAFNPDVLAQLKQVEGVTTTLGSGGGTWEQVELNAAGPALADLALRRAILTALDTVQARKRIYGDVEPALRTSHFFEATSPHHDDVLAGTGFGSGDLDAARAILRGAGYTGADPGGSLAKGGVEVPDLRFVVIAGHPTRTTFVELVQAQLAAVGITAAPVPVPASSFLRTVSGGEFDLTVFAFDGGPLVVGAPAQLFHSDSPVNFTGVDDPEIDRVIDQIPSLVDLEAVAGAANDVARRAVGHATLLPLWDNPSFLFVRDGFANVQDNRNSSVRAFWNAEAWALAANR